jgi:hypothetical protein
MSGDLAQYAIAAISAPWSTRSFGEYTFLEDSRYTSQAKNARRKNSHTIATVNSTELGKSSAEVRSPGTGLAGNIAMPRPATTSARTNIGI